MNVQHIFDLVMVLTQKEMKVRYKSTILGYLWSIAQPLAFAFVFFVAFKIVMRIQMENYALFLIAGLFPWQWISNSIGISTNTFLGNASIIKKVNFPRNVLVVATVIQDMIHFILSIPVIILFMYLGDVMPSIKWLAGIPILLIIQFLMVYGVSLVVSSINLFFRDIERLTSILIMFVFYLTPIIYPESMVPEPYRYLLLDYNPVAPLVISWRELFLEGSLELYPLALSLAYAIVAFLAGQLVYRRLSWKFAEAL